MFRGLLIGAMTLTAASCIDSKDDLPKGEVDQSSPPGSPIALDGEGKADGQTTFAVALQSAHPYANNLARDYRLELGGIVPPCTSRVRLHFAALRTEAGYDFVHVLDQGGTPVQSLDGRRDGTWSDWVSAVTPTDGKAVTLRLETDYSITDYGFRIDQVEVETQVRCPLIPIRVCDPGYFDVTPTPDTCECRGQTQCAEDAWVEIEHSVGGGFTGEVNGRQMTGTEAFNTKYTTSGGDTTTAIGSLDRPAAQALVHAIVDSGILDRPEVAIVDNWNETFRIRIGTRAVAFTRPQGTFPADEAALIAQFEELFTCGGAGTALSCDDGFECAQGACVVDQGCVCTEQYDPVCGADGRTYGNACHAGCANASVVHAGECGVAGDTCGGIGSLDCQDDHKCRYGTSTYEPPTADATGACVVGTYCDAVADCAGLPHIAVPGTWACNTNSCSWQAGPAWQTATGSSFSTAHPYGNNANVWKELYLPAGASKMRLRTEGTFNLENGYDKLEVWAYRSPSWIKVQTFTGTTGPAITDEFGGQYFYLHFVSDSSVTKHGFAVTAEYAMQ